MKKSLLDEVRHEISSMMTKENSVHTKLVFDLRLRIDSSVYDINDILEKLNLVHRTKIETLEEVYTKISKIK